MPRLDRGIQYSAAFALYSANQLRVLEYWIARSQASEATPFFGRLCRATTERVPPKIKRRARGPPLFEIDRVGSPGGASAPPGLEGYFFFAFLAFLAFFAFFAFLAIASSFGLMDGNATRGMLGGGPTSQHPQLQSQQIRGPLPRTVTQASSRYPQLLCVLTRFWRRDALHAFESFQVRDANDRSTGRPPGLTMRQRADAFCLDRGLRRAIFTISKPRLRLPRWGSESV